MKIEIPAASFSATIPIFITVDTFLDEELDVSPISIENTEVEKPFPRFTPAILTASDERTEEKSYWLIGSDTATKGINGKTQHTIQLIEPTKWLERFMVGNKTVTQPIRPDYLTSAAVASPDDVDGETSRNLLSEYAYKSVMDYSDPLPIYPPFCFESMSGLVELMQVDYIDYKCTISSDESGFYKEIKKRYKNQADVTSSSWDTLTPIEYISVASGGVFHVRYEMKTHETYPAEAFGTFISSFAISAVAPAATKERTLKNAALSMIYAAESLNEGESLTFKLSEELAEELEKITAPELTVTNATLREALDEIAKYVGAITRLNLIPTDDGFIYEINFEKYCKDEEADLSELGGPVNEIICTVSAEDYCTALDATAENIVNYADGGTIRDPSPTLFRTLRSEDASYRVTEGSAKIITAFPIERIDGLTCRIYDDGKAYDFDLFSYLYESTEYGALSSYDATYPFSKAYALCYTIGQKSIEALDFTIPNPVHSIFETPAIVNIINREIRANNGEGGKYQGLPTFSNMKALDFTKLLFRITYVPTGSLRVRTRKPSSFGKPESVLAYNQSAAKLDAKAFGRSMFGAALRMGNEITTYQYAPPIGAKVPQKGERFGEDGYISEVHVEYGLTYKKVTLEVSEGFNRLSQFVGVNKSQRIFEISERMSLDRYIVYEDLCLIGTKDRSGGGAMVSPLFISYLKNAFTQETPPRVDVHYIVTQGFDEEGGALAPCLHPAIYYGIGNALTFTATFEDNYGAGRRIDDRSKASGTDDSTDYYATERDVRYTDLFGRVDTMSFGVYGKPTVEELDESVLYDAADTLPQKKDWLEERTQVLALTPEGKRLKIDKDSRECLKSITYQLSFLEADGIKVSPFFAENLSIAQDSSKIVFTLITSPINNLTAEVPYIEGVTLKEAETEGVNNRAKITFKLPDKLQNGCVGWAAVAYDKNAVGGKMRFLFGQNCKLTAGQELSLYLTFFRKNNIREKE